MNRIPPITLAAYIAASAVTAETFSFCTFCNKKPIAWPPTIGWNDARLICIGDEGRQLCDFQAPHLEREFSFWNDFDWSEELVVKSSVLKKVPDFGCGEGFPENYVVISRNMSCEYKLTVVE